MTDRDRPTRDDVTGARRQLTQVHARLREEGEEAVVADIWDAVVDDIAALPDVREALRLAERPDRPPRATAVRPHPDDDEEAIHQAVVELVQEAQRTGDELRASRDRAQRRT